MDRHSAELVSHLEKHPSWLALRELAAEKQTEMWAKLAKDLARQQEGTVSAERLQYLRGVAKGMDLLLKAPHTMLAEIDRIGADEH